MLAELVRGVGSLLFPAGCPSCRFPTESGSAASPCPRCAGLLPRCEPSWSAGVGPLDGAITPFLYEGVSRELILALKYRGRISLAPFLADCMAEQVLGRLGRPPADRVLPVPLHPTRFRERSFNQAELLAGLLAQRLRIPCETGWLIRCRPTLPQPELTRQERAENVRGAFDLRRGERVKGLRLLLVDDVLTTGSTAEACADLLKSAGAGSVTVVAAARG